MCERGGERDTELNSSHINIVIVRVQGKQELNMLTNKRHKEPANAIKLALA
jgi:hypothetical protein